MDFFSLTIALFLISMFLTIVNDNIPYHFDLFDTIITILFITSALCVFFGILCNLLIQPIKVENTFLTCSCCPCCR